MTNQTDKTVAPGTGIQTEAERLKRQRQKNIAVALLLVAFVAIVYVVAIVRMSEGGPG